MRSAKLTSSASCSDSLPNADSRLTDLCWPFVASSPNFATKPMITVLWNPEYEKLQKNAAKWLFCARRNRLTRVDLPATVMMHATERP